MSRPHDCTAKGNAHVVWYESGLTAWRCDRCRDTWVTEVRPGGQVDPRDPAVPPVTVTTDVGERVVPGTPCWVARELLPGRFPDTNDAYEILAYVPQLDLRPASVVAFGHQLAPWTRWTSREA
jgi:hypothetical protein